jgi:hypothetical protein
MLHDCSGLLAPAVSAKMVLWNTSNYMTIIYVRLFGVSAKYKTAASSYQAHAPGLPVPLSSILHW